MGKKLSLLSCACVCASILWAQQDTTKKGQLLEEVIVTANKQVQKESSTGKVVTVINHEQLAKSSGKTVAELLNEQVGITITGALQPVGSVQTLTMRGATSGRTLVLIDGIPVSDASDINGNYDLNLLSINDIERVEICKGAQSTLYGSDAIAGVINIITTKSNVTKPVNVLLSRAWGNQKTNKSNVQLYGKMNKLSYTARYAKLRTEGFPAAYDSTGKGNFRKDGYNGDMVNGSVQYALTPQLQLIGFGRYSHYKTDFAGGAFTDGNNNSVNKNFYTGGGFRYAKDSLHLTGNYQYGTLERTLNYLDYGAVYNYKAISHYAELYASIPLSNGFSILTGGDFRYGSANNNYTASYGNGATNDTALSQNSLYGSLQFNSTHFNASLGGRLNTHSRYGSNYTYTFNPSYTINKNFRVFGSIATGFKAPTLYQLYDVYSGNKNLSAEKSINYEIGVQGQFKGFSDRLVLFYRNTTDGIDYNTIANKYFNYAEQTARGIEYEITVQPIKGGIIKANYSYLSTSQHILNRVTSKDTIYNYTLRIPQHTVNITVGYNILPNFYLSLNGKYVSSRQDVGGFDPITYNTLPDVTLDGYFILGGYGEYELTKNVKVFADAKNIGNQKFFDIRGYNSIPFLICGGISVHL